MTAASEKIAIVTGANQGLGFALAEGLAQQLKPEDTVYLTGRDSVRVRAAVARIAGARATVRGELLDVSNAAAVSAFADAILARHGGVNIVFSNAAARLVPEAPPAELVGPFVNTNNLGTTRMLRAFSPILRPRGRLLVVASAFGSLRELPSHLHARFDSELMGLDDLDATMLAWRDAVAKGGLRRRVGPSGSTSRRRSARLRLCACSLANGERPTRSTEPLWPPSAPDWLTRMPRVRGSRT
jgi:carbonyl reductase 1